MSTKSITLEHEFVDVNHDTSWGEYYALLRSVARHLVNDLKVPSWKGQEDDIIEDIVQETMRRAIERVHKTERGEADPILSLKQMMVAIAYNYYKDIRRHDRRLSRVQPDGEFYNYRVKPCPNLLDTATEQVYQERLFTLIAHEVEHFPNKQKKAILTDLANRMCFDSQPTPLQSAFLEEGIQLQQYQQSLPTSQKERSNHSALLSYAYKRLAHLASVQQYAEVV